MGLSSVSAKQELLLSTFSSFYSKAYFLSWFSREHYCVAFKVVQPPKFQISSKPEVHLEIILNMHNTREPMGMRGTQRAPGQMEANILLNKRTRLFPSFSQNTWH